MPTAKISRNTWVGISMPKLSRYCCYYNKIQMINFDEYTNKNKIKQS